MNNKVDIGIIGAMQIEVDGIKAAMENKVDVVISGISFTKGELYGKTVVTAVCGIGKVFSALCAQTMILGFSPEIIVNTGVAGTLTNELSIGDVVIADKVVQHDIDTTPLGDEPGLISGLNMVYIPADEGISKTLAECVKSRALNSNAVRSQRATALLTITTKKQE